MDADPHSGEFPSSQVMIDALPLGEVARPHAPLDSPLRHIKDGIEHRSHTQGARASTAFGGGDQIFDPLPFFVSQVAWIDFFVHLPIVPTYEDFSDRLLGLVVIPAAIWLNVWAWHSWVAPMAERQAL